jgi:cellulose synthase (UDP-forming)
MEYVTGRYPWAGPDAAAFIAAYRHVVDRCRASGAAQTLYVWSPAGNKAARAYWPGRPYADYVGLSVYGFPDWDLARHGTVRSFDEIFGERYARIADLDRPVMIAELGVTGAREHQIKWMTEALLSAHRYPRLRSIVYFHAVDSRAAWPEEFRVPDWRIDLSAVWLRFLLRA